MNKQSVLWVLLLGAGLAQAAAAPDAAAKARYQEASKVAASEYAADKKLCTELGTGNERLQCLKDAKAKYDGALAQAKTAMTVPVAKPAALASDEAKVLSIQTREKEGEGSALGVIAGGVAGALLGNQVGGGSGKDLATIAGAAGGAYAGHKVEQKMKTSKVWLVTVKFGNGSEESFELSQEPNFAVGEVVKRAGNSIQRR